MKVRKKKDLIELYCKHSRHFTIGFPNKHAKEDGGSIINKYAFPTSTHQLFAFIHNAFEDGFPPVSFTLEEGLSFLFKVLYNS